MPLVSIGAFRGSIFLIDEAAFLVGPDILFVVRPFFDFGEHEVAVDRPDALDEKFGVQNFG